MRSRCLRQRLAQRRQRRLGLRQRRLLCREIAAIGVAQVQLALQRVAHLGVDRDDLNGRIDLAAQRSLGDGRDHEVRRQRKIGRLDLKALHVGKGFERFDRPPIEAPDVERVSHRQLRGIELENAGAGGGHRSEYRRGALVCRIEVGLDQREELSLLRVNALLRRTQRRQRRLQVRIILQRLLDHGVQLPRFEQRPPLVGNVAAGNEMLLRSGGHGCRGGL